MNKEKIQVVLAGYNGFSKTKYLLSLGSRRKEGRRLWKGQGMKVKGRIVIKYAMFVESIFTGFVDKKSELKGII